MEHLFSIQGGAVLAIVDVMVALRFLLTHSNARWKKVFQEGIRPSVRNGFKTCVIKSVSK